MEEFFDAPIDDGRNKPLGYQTGDGELEVRDFVDATGVAGRGYCETELGQHQRWMRSAPELYEKYMALLAELARLREAEGWRPIETLPMKTYTITGGEVSDGYHTMSELYDHRRALTAALFSAWKALGVPVWKAKQHADGTMFDGYFIVMAQPPCGQVSYHYGLEHWHEFDVPEVERTPEWDGHGAPDVIARLLKWALTTG